MNQYLVKCVVLHKVEAFGMYQRAFHFFSQEDCDLTLQAEALINCRELGIKAENIESCMISVIGSMKTARPVVHAGITVRG